MMRAFFCLSFLVVTFISAPLASAQGFTCPKFTTFHDSSLGTSPSSLQTSATVEVGPFKMPSQTTISYFPLYVKGNECSASSLTVVLRSSTSSRAVTVLNTADSSQSTFQALNVTFSPAFTVSGNIYLQVNTTASASCVYPLIVAATNVYQKPSNTVLKEKYTFPFPSCTADYVDKDAGIPLSILTFIFAGSVISLIPFKFLNCSSKAPWTKILYGITKFFHYVLGLYFFACASAFVGLPSAVTILGVTLLFFAGKTLLSIIGTPRRHSSSARSFGVVLALFVIRCATAILGLIKTLSNLMLLWTSFDVMSAVSAYVNIDWKRFINIDVKLNFPALTGFFEMWQGILAPIYDVLKIENWSFCIMEIYFKFVLVCFCGMGLVILYLSHLLPWVQFVVCKAAQRDPNPVSRSLKQSITNGFDFVVRYTFQVLTTFMSRIILSVFLADWSGVRCFDYLDGSNAFIVAWFAMKIGTIVVAIVFIVALFLIAHALRWSSKSSMDKSITDIPKTFGDFYLRVAKGFLTGDISSAFPEPQSTVTPAHMKQPAPINQSRLRPNPFHNYTVGRPQPTAKEIEDKATKAAFVNLVFSWPLVVLGMWPSGTREALSVKPLIKKFGAEEDAETELEMMSSLGSYYCLIFQSIPGVGVIISKIGEAMNENIIFTSISTHYMVKLKWLCSLAKVILLLFTAFAPSTPLLASLLASQIPEQIILFAQDVLNVKETVEDIPT